MKFIFSILFLLGLLSTKASAQQTHFLFVQSESRQPFNITLNKKVYSSTASGYLIIPKLAEGQHNFTVGFGGNSIPDQPFSCVIEKKDVGFNLKNFGEKGWGLFNLQTFAITMSGDAATNSTVARTTEKPPEKLEEKKVISKPAENAFKPDVDAVSKVDEQTVAPLQKLDSPAAKVIEEIKSPSVPASSLVRDTVATQKDEVKSTAVPSRPLGKDTTPAAKEIETAVSAVETKAQAFSPSQSFSPMNAKSKISKISELKGAEAFYITYVDVYENGGDTVELLIPNSKVATTVMVEVKPKDGPKFLEIEAKPQQEVTKIATEPALAKEADSLKAADAKPQVTSRCGTIATEDDFLKLRKRMAAATDNDAMVAEAKKTFKIRCFSTIQVKNLAYLFLTDEARYHFFDAAYPYVSDPSEFAPLSIMLADSYYINRFKAMLLN
jgi:hypothetical protein